MTDGTKKVFNNADEITEMLKNPTELERCIRNAKLSWRNSVGLGSDASITNFIGRLRKIGASKKFIKNADDYINILRKTVKVIAKMS